MFEDINKDAYNIRLEVLIMAKELVLREYQEKIEDFYRIEKSMKDLKVLASGLPKHNIPFPTSEDIIKKAKELYMFVEKK